MPPKTETKDYESLLAEECDALRSYIALLEHKTDGMKPETFHLVSRLLEAKSALIDAERAAKKALEQDRTTLLKALADALAICRLNGLKNRVAHLEEIHERFDSGKKFKQKKPDVRWN